MVVLSAMYSLPNANSTALLASNSGCGAFNKRIWHMCAPGHIMPKKPPSSSRALVVNRQKILRALLQAGKPLNNYQISKATGVRRESVRAASESAQLEGLVKVHHRLPAKRPGLKSEYLTLTKAGQERAARCNPFLLPRRLTNDELYVRRQRHQRLMLDRLTEWNALAEEIVMKKKPRTDFSTGIEIDVDKKGETRMRVHSGPNIRGRKRRRRSLNLKELEELLSKYPPSTTLRVGEPLPPLPSNQQQASRG